MAKEQESNMKQTVKGTQLIMRIDSYGEPVQDYVDIVKPYFGKIAHHHQQHNSMNKDALMIYSYFPCDVSCDGCKQKPIGIKIPVIAGKFPIGKSFYDSNFRDIPCSRLIQITYGSHAFGYYCIRNNVLVTTDFAHDNGNQPHVAAIFEYLKEAGLLTELTRPENQAKITLGTDPEMEALVQGKCIPGNMLPSINVYNKAYISHDGARNQRELRPDPSESPEELVDNIKDLIRISSFFNEDLSIEGKLFTLGGHIHIGGTSPSTELITILDYFLNPFNEFSNEERKKSKYGKKGDFRYQPHGFEYRTPPAAWLLTPELALKTLQLTKVVVESLINGKDVTISNTDDPTEYIENLKQFPLCTDEWVKRFLDEIEWARHNLDKPLAKTWGVDIPTEFKVQKRYKYEPKEEVQHVPIRVVTLNENVETFNYNEEENEIDPDTGEPYA